MTKTESKFKAFLRKLGHIQLSQFSGNKYGYKFSVDLRNKQKNEIDVDFYYLPTDEINQKLYELQQVLWNENRLQAYIIISNYKTYIFDAKVKPSRDDNFLPEIKSFAYGVNSSEFSEEELELLKKESLDSGYFWDYILQNLTNKNRLEVDIDLLLNLIELKNNLLNVRNDNITAIHFLILRCLFIKYLEDRGIYKNGYLVELLEKRKPEQLYAAFEEMKLINGDLFRSEDLSKYEMKEEYIIELEKFFTSDYRSGQASLFFPYRFDIIPVQLISHVYEAFVEKSDKKEKGIYYTPLNIVKFILSATLQEKLKSKNSVTVLDPACGSGIFLVESFKMIISHLKIERNYYEKLKVLETQIFGIDVDSKALQITAFSLYLTLLENENTGVLQQKIKNRSPFLPTLIGKTLLHKNTITDEIIFDHYKKINKSSTFDCIVVNPPWGSVPRNGDDEHKNERAAKKKMQIYNTVSDYQRSQFFLLRIEEWCSQDTLCSLIVNNSNFFNHKAINFRKKLLEKYRLLIFYELSGINSILFKKREIGSVGAGDKKEKIVVGANEPSAILVFDKSFKTDNTVKYITPKLNNFSKFFKIISFSESNIKKVKQTDLINEDILWRIFVNGDWEDYQLIKKIDFLKDPSIKITCRSGLKPQKSMRSLGKPIYKKLIDNNSFERYFLKPDCFKYFNINREMERDRKNYYDYIFKDERILLYFTPKEEEGLRLKAVHTNDEYVFKHDILSLKFQSVKKIGIEYYEAILNSSLIGYYLYNLSAQWGKGPKRAVLRNSDVASLPIAQIYGNSSSLREIIRLVKDIKKLKSELYKNGYGNTKNKNIDKMRNSLLEKDLVAVNLANEIKIREEEIDNLLFKLYNLMPFEINLINDFVEINSNRKNDTGVTSSDMDKYAQKFKEILKLVVSDENDIEFSYNINKTIGAIICFEIIEKARKNSIQNFKDKIDILRIVKKKQILKSYFSSIISEEKIKIYDKSKLYLIKSNSYRDWTLSQAMSDAKEEISEILKRLPNK